MGRKKQIKVTESQSPFKKIKFDLNGVNDDAESRQGSSEPQSVPPDTGRGEGSNFYNSTLNQTRFNYRYFLRSSSTRSQDDDDEIYNNTRHMKPIDIQRMILGDVTHVNINLEYDYPDDINMDNEAASDIVIENFPEITNDDDIEIYESEFSAKTKSPDQCMESELPEPLFNKKSEFTTHEKSSKSLVKKPEIVPKILKRVTPIPGTPKKVYGSKKNLETNEKVAAADNNKKSTDPVKKQLSRPKQVTPVGFNSATPTKPIVSMEIDLTEEDYIKETTIVPIPVARKNAEWPQNSTQVTPVGFNSATPTKPIVVIDLTEEDYTEENATLKTKKDQAISKPPTPVCWIDKIHQPGAIRLCWDLSDNEKLIHNIRKYQIFNYEEGSIDQWRLVAEVDPIPLPIACKIIQLKVGLTYHFAVRAIDHNMKPGELSKPESIAIFYQ